MRFPSLMDSKTSSVVLSGTLYLYGEFSCESGHHRDTENPQRSTKALVRTCCVSLFMAAIFAGLLCLSAAAFAKDAQPNEDPQIAQRMKNLTEQLRCLVCQSETLSESRAEWAETVRKEIREQMKAGKSDQQIVAFLTERYGDFV